MSRLIEQLKETSRQFQQAGNYKAGLEALNVAAALAVGHDGSQGHPDFTVEEWQDDVANSVTRLGYTDWLATQEQIHADWGRHAQEGFQ